MARVIESSACLFDLLSFFSKADKRAAYASSLLGIHSNNDRGYQHGVGVVVVSDGNLYARRDVVLGDRSGAAVTCYTIRSHLML